MVLPYDVPQLFTPRLLYPENRALPVVADILSIANVCPWTDDLCANGAGGRCRKLRKGLLSLRCWGQAACVRLWCVEQWQRSKRFLRAHGKILLLLTNIGSYVACVCVLGIRLFRLNQVGLSLGCSDTCMQLFRIHLET